MMAHDPRLSPLSGELKSLKSLHVERFSSGVVHALRDSPIAAQLDDLTLHLADDEHNTAYEVPACKALKDVPFSHLRTLRYIGRARSVGHLRDAQMPILDSVDIHLDTEPTELDVRIFTCGAFFPSLRRLHIEPLVSSQSRKLVDDFNEEKDTERPARRDIQWVQGPMRADTRELLGDEDEAS